MSDSDKTRIAGLPCWQAAIDIEPLSGGMTNLNYKVTDGDEQYVVRFGEDDPVHLISRANEIASCRAAFEIGVSPELVHHEAGILVVRFIEGKVFDEADVRVDQNLERIVALLKRFHHELPGHFSGVAVMFWVFQVLRHYHNLLVQGKSAHAARLPGLATIGAELEAAVGPVEIVFGHNDLLPANFIDDGDKIWLIDFDYAGFNSPLFDLSNLASNNELSDLQERAMLEQYFDVRPDHATLSSYHAMKCASLLRETMWSMVSELNSRVDMDFADYTQKNLMRFESVYTEYKNNYH
ncbi:MAG: phosphotransferase family protein [Gammaproteobacteria bacterium]|nr:phosphotransferase family protein [Gammaproteobacteria bacterium]MDH3857578.1 phosphotransferase family protein [Gammaproteobacteria bacterium]